jgi:hypothetical protein
VLNDFQTLFGTEPVGEFLPWLGWVDTVTGTERKMKRTFQALDAVLEKVIDDHRRPGRQVQEEDRRDFVDVLLDVNKNEKEYGIRMETNEIKAIILVNTAQMSSWKSSSSSYGDGCRECKGTTEEHYLSENAPCGSERGAERSGGARFQARERHASSPCDPVLEFNSFSCPACLNPESPRNPPAEKGSAIPTSSKQQLQLI